MGFELSYVDEVGRGYDRFARVAESVDAGCLGFHLSSTSLLTVVLT